YDKAKQVFQSEIWLKLNQGIISEQEAKLQYQLKLSLSPDDTETLFYYVKATQILLHGSMELLLKLKQAGYKLYALTDNVTEIIDYLKKTYDFWSLFEGSIISANEGVLKPDPTIYKSVLNRFDLRAEESVFLDDMAANVKGAEAVGIQAIQFYSARQCEQELANLGITV
ncbi:HAD family phosphatase, partial [Vibrio sp.]|nr:HAD family phosphatase [Vibrio sp.]